jgi:hypothetical protein
MTLNKEPQAIEVLTKEFVDTLPATDDAYYEAAAVKFIIREFMWAMVHRFPRSKEAILEQLETMTEVIREHKEDA